MGDLVAFNDYESFCERMREQTKGRGDEYEEPVVTTITRTQDDWLKAWGVPARMRDNVLPKEGKGFHTTEAISAINQFMACDKGAWCLILSADKGAGKSTAAAYWLSKMVEETASMPDKPPTFWRTGPGLARINNYNDDWDSAMMAKYMVLDDLGVEYLDKNGNFLTRLDELLYTRHNEYLRTIITTNLNGGDFKTRYGERIRDRVKEGEIHGGGFIEFTGKSLRCPEND